MTREPPQPQPDDWRVDAACTGQDPRLFTDPRPDSDDTDRALGICHACPVRHPCLNEALTRPASIDVGIWGATTPDERRGLRHPRRRPAPPPPQLAGLFPTLEGDLADLTGRALVVRLPAPPQILVFIDQQPSLRTHELADAWRHIAASIDELQPQALAPFVLTDDGEITDPARRTLITRLPAPPHLLVLVEGRPHARTSQLSAARHHAAAALQAPPGRTLPPGPNLPGDTDLPTIRSRGLTNRADDSSAVRPDGLAVTLAVGSRR